MKKLHIALLGTLFVFSTSHAITAGLRQSAWNARLKKLQEEIQSISAVPGAPPGLVTLLNDEFRATQHLCKKIETEELLPPSPESAKPRDIIDTPHPAAGAFALCYAWFCTSMSDNRDIAAGSRRAVEAHLRDYAQSLYGPVDEAWLKSVLGADITKTEWRYIAMETGLGMMTRRRDALHEKAMAERLAGTPDSAVTPAPPQDDIEKNAGVFFAVIGSEIGNVRDIDIEESPTWWCVKKRIEKEIAGYARMIELASAAGSAPGLAQLRAWQRDPSAFENAIFRDAAQRYFDTRGIGPTTYDKSRPGGKSYTMNIPKNPDGAAIFSEIDALRKKTASSFSGTDDEARFAALEAQFNAVMEKHLSDSETGFAAEENTVQRLRHENGGIKIPNEDAYLSAKAVYTDRRNLIRGYVVKSVEFCKWASQSKRIQSGDIFNSVNFKITVYGEQIDFIKTCMADASSAAPHAPKPLYERYASSMRRADNIIKAFDFSAGIGKRQARFIDAADGAKLRQLKTGFAEKTKSARTQIRSLHIAAAKKRASQTAYAAATRPDARARIAQMEIDHSKTSIDAYMSYYGSLRHAETALNRYASAYAAIHDEIAAGKSSPALNQAIRQQSLIPSVDGFDAGAIRDEYRARVFIKKHVAASLSRLTLVARECRRDKTKIIDPPDDAYFSTVKRRLAGAPSVPVASWKMTESNFADIDRKAVRTLAARWTKAQWQASRENAGANVENAPVTVTLSGVSLNIPAGWVEKETGPEYADGMARTFASMDNAASITILSLPSSGKTLEEISAEWLRGSGASMVRQRWGRRDALSYFWAISRGADKRIIESFTIESGGSAIVLAGTSTRARYPAFKNILASVFQSVRE